MEHALTRIASAAAIALALGCGGDGASRAGFDPSHQTEISALRLGTLELLKDGRFAELERRVTGYQAAYERGEIDELAAGIAFSPFYTSHDYASERLDAWVEAMPDSWAARAARAKYHRRMGILYRGTLFIHNTTPEQLDAMRREFDVAEADYEAALEANPRLMWCYANLIDIARNRGERERGRELLERALAVDADAFMARDAYLTSLQASWGGSEEEWQRYQEELAERSEQNPLFLVHAERLLAQRNKERARKGERDEVIQLYRDAVERHGTHPFVYGLARLYRDAGRYDEAIAAYTRAIELVPGWYPGYQQRALARRDAGQLLPAIEDLRTALRFDPLDPGLHEQLGAILERGRNYAGAAEEYATALEWDQKPWTLRQLGWLLVTHLDDAGGAVPLLIRAAQIDSKSTFGWYWLGRALQDLGRDEARTAYERYLALADPSSAIERERIAQVEAYLDPEAAKREAAVARADDPAGAPAGRLPGLAWIGLAAP